MIAGTVQGAAHGHRCRAGARERGTGVSPPQARPVAPIVSGPTAAPARGSTAAVRRRSATRADDSRTGPIQAARTGERRVASRERDPAAGLGVFREGGGRPPSAAPHAAEPRSGLVSVVPLAAGLAAAARRDWSFSVRRCYRSTKPVISLVWLPPYRFICRSLVQLLPDSKGCVRSSAWICPSETGRSR